jgi:hypothetical protein
MDKEFSEVFFASKIRIKTAVKAALRRFATQRISARSPA